VRGPAAFAEEPWSSQPAGLSQPAYPAPLPQQKKPEDDRDTKTPGLSQPAYPAPPSQQKIKIKQSQNDRGTKPRRNPRVLPRKARQRRSLAGSRWEI